MAYFEMRLPSIHTKCEGKSREQVQFQAIIGCAEFLKNGKLGLGFWRHRSDAGLGMQEIH